MRTNKLIEKFKDELVSDRIAMVGFPLPVLKGLKRIKLKEEFEEGKNIDNSTFFRTLIMTHPHIVQYYNKYPEWFSNEELKLNGESVTTEKEKAIQT